MKTIKVYWVRLDRHGSVKSAYRGANGKLYYPRHVGSVWADLRAIVKQNNPRTSFDVESCGAIYEIGGTCYVCESVNSKVFHPLDSVLAKLESRNPVVGNSSGGLAYRAQIVSVAGTVS